MIEPEAPLEQRQGSFLGHVNVVMLTYITDGALAFATGILVARALGPDGRGAYALFVLSAAFVQLVLGLGAGNATIYYLNRRELSMRDVVAASHVVTLGAAVVTLAVAAIIATLDEGGIAGTGVSPWLLAAAGPALMYWNLMRLTLQAESRFVDLAIVTVAQQSILLIAVASLMGGGDPTATQIAGCLAGATAVAGLLGLQRVGVHHLDLWLVFRPQIATLRRLAGFGLQGEAGNILQLLNYRLDQYIVRAYVGLAGVGIYAVGASMTEAIFIMANAVALVLLPRLSASEDDAYWMAPVATRNTIMIAALGALGLALAAPLLVPLAFGGAYDDSIEPLWLLLPGTVALCGSKVLTSYIFSQGKPLVNTGITVISLAVTVVADFALIPWLGVNGAAIASSLAYAAHFAAALFAYGRISGRSPLLALIPDREDARLYADAWRTVTARVMRRPAPESDRPQRA
jgi:O-antigen/teichoic acid export membrane protein